MAADLAITWVRLGVGVGIDPRAELRGFAWLYLVDAGLACVGFLAALAGAAHPLLLLAVLPLGGLLALFAHERRGRIENALELQRAAQEGRERLQTIVRNSSDCILIVGRRRDDADADRLRRADLRRRVPSRASPLLDHVHVEDAAQVRAFVASVAEKPDEPQEAEWRMRYADGSFRHVAAAATSLLDDARVAGIVLTVRDVEDRKAFEEQLRHRAFHDALTGLANRALFYDRIEHALTRGARADAPVGVLFVDLDDFKTVNDTRGHADGDRLLQEVANRLTTCLRAGDTAARLGGDEFGVLVENVLEPGALEATAARVLEALRQPVELANGVVVVSASVGMAISTIQRPRRRGVPAQGRPRDVRGQARRQAPRAALRAAAGGRRAHRRRAVVRARRRAARRDRGRARRPGRDHDGLPADHGPAHRAGRGLRVAVALQPRAAPRRRTCGSRRRTAAGSATRSRPRRSSPRWRGAGPARRAPT